MSEIEATEKPKRVLEVEVEVSQESLDCIIEMAGYGIAYWASAAEYDDEARTYTITESGEGDYAKHVVTYDKIIESFWKVANPGSKVKGLGSMVRGYALEAVVDGTEQGKGDIDAGHVDADLADSIIQIAIFDEVIFG